MSPCKLPSLSVPFNITATLMLLAMRGGAGLTGTQLPDSQPDPQEDDFAVDTNTTTTETLQEEVEWLKVGAS